MNNLSKYIIEKLHLNKDIKVSNKTLDFLKHLRGFFYRYLKSIHWEDDEYKIEINEKKKSLYIVFDQYLYNQDKDNISEWLNKKIHEENFQENEYDIQVFGKDNTNIIIVKVNEKN